jgi:hypothetical protein
MDKKNKTDRICGLEPLVCFTFDELTANKVFGCTTGHAGALPLGGDLVCHGAGECAEARAGPRGGGEGAGGAGEVSGTGKAGQGHGGDVESRSLGRCRSRRDHVEEDLERSQWQPRERRRGLSRDHLLAR